MVFLIGKLFGWRKNKRGQYSRQTSYSNKIIENGSIIEDFAEAIERDLSGENGYDCKPITPPIKLYPLEINDDDILLDEIVETNKPNIKLVINKSSYQLEDMGYTPRQNYLEEKILSKFALAGENADIDSISINLDKMLNDDWKEYRKLNSEDMLFVVKRFYEKADTIRDAYNDGGKNYLKAMALADKFMSTAKNIETKRNINYKSSSRVEQLVS